MTARDRKVFTREILLGFWKVHILHHATQQPVVGQWMPAELRHHGYRVSPGTLYPLLERHEQHGGLSCTVDEAGGVRARRYYRTTRRGRAVLDAAMEMLGDLRDEAAPAEPGGRVAPLVAARRADALVGGGSWSVDARLSRRDGSHR